jgi:hypothetical protein
MNSYPKTSLALWIVFILMLFQNCKKENPSDIFDNLDILAKIHTLEGVSVTEITPGNGYSRAFQLDISQPVDHNNPDGPKFTQRVYLSHLDEDVPMVFAPNGYRAGPLSQQEIAGILQANILNVTHRYFTDSKPEPTDWQYLTIQQSAADHHHIVELFKKIYKGKWISSGASKSGLAALFHHRYFPDDVDATIAYVAPFIFGVKDMRYPEYLRNIGGSECFDKLTLVQIYALEHRTAIIDLMETYIQSSGKTYSLDRDLLLELHIMDYPFTFWQYYNYSCSSIPDTSATTPTEIFNHYNSIAPLSSFSDESIDYYAPFAYQAVTELGAPAYQTDYLSDLLIKIDPNDPGNPNYELLAPGGPDYTFNSSTISEIYNWLQSYGERIIYIYGSNDPWSAGAIELNPLLDAVFIMQADENHTVRITDLTNQSIVYDALERWLGIQINPGVGKKAEIESGQPSFRLAN